MKRLMKIILYVMSILLIIYICGIYPRVLINEFQASARAYKKIINWQNIISSDRKCNYKDLTYIFKVNFSKSKNNILNEYQCNIYEDRMRQFYNIDSNYKKSVLIDLMRFYDNELYFNCDENLLNIVKKYSEKITNVEQIEAIIDRNNYSSFIMFDEINRNIDIEKSKINGIFIIDIIGLNENGSIKNKEIEKKFIEKLKESEHIKIRANEFKTKNKIIMDNDT